MLHYSVQLLLMWAVHGGQYFYFYEKKSDRINKIEQVSSNEPVSRWYWEYQRLDPSGHPTIYQR